MAKPAKVNSGKKEIAKNILIALGMVGVVSTVMVAPGLAKALPLLKKIDVYRINQEIKRLYKRGLIEIKKRQSGVTEIRLTKEGKEKLKKYEFENLKLKKPKTWDKIWRIVIFDIPIEKNNLRNRLRDKMKEIGFYKLQNSVFVYPYPCYEVVVYLKEQLGLKGEVEYIEAEKLESQNRLIGHFFT